VKLIFTTIALPPGMILAGILLLGVLIWKCRPQDFPYWKGKLVAACAGLFLLGYVLATPWCGLALSAMLSGQVRGKTLDDPRAADAIVVLTAGITNAGPVGWLPKPNGVHRLAVAYELQRMINLRMPVIVSGGHTEGGQNPSEAAATAAFFARQRTELTPTELEEASTDTYESAMQLAPVLAKRAARNVLLVTDEVHMLRAAATFRARGVDVVPVPALHLPEGLGVRTYLPSLYGLGLTTEALYEIYGLAAYLVSGKISWNDIAYN